MFDDHSKAFIVSAFRTYLTLFKLNIFFLYTIFKELLNGGDERNRTADPLLARQVLSQLSYTPMILVGLDGLEPSTSRLSGVRSNHLSYRPYSQFLPISGN